MTFDFITFNTETEITASPQSSLLWTRSSGLSHSTPSKDSLRLDLPSDDLVKGLSGFGTESDMGSPAHKRGIFDKNPPSFTDEEGVLLQADFEFDEDGNIVELGSMQPSHARGNQAGGNVNETPVMPSMKGTLERETRPVNPQQMLIDEDMETGIGKVDAEVLVDGHISGSIRDSLPMNDNDRPTNDVEITARQAARVAKILPLDNQIGLRNTDLAQWNNEYLQHMAIVSKQKRQNKLSTQAKKNAVFWVFGMGIGSVGTGLGITRVPHPLQSFSGDELHAALCGGISKSDRKRNRVADEDDDLDSEERRVRAREEEEEHVGRGGGIQPLNIADIMQEVRTEHRYLFFGTC